VYIYEKRPMHHFYLSQFEFMTIEFEFMTMELGFDTPATSTS
jgi:hypothetical protein